MINIITSKTGMTRFLNQLEDGCAPYFEIRTNCCRLDGYVYVNNNKYCIWVRDSRCRDNLLIFKEFLTLEETKELFRKEIKW